jgi:hypothetical protein
VPLVAVVLSLLERVLSSVAVVRFCSSLPHATREEIAALKNEIFNSLTLLHRE